MLLLSEISGTHEPNGGEGLTLEDLLDLLKSIPSSVRRDSYLRIVDPDSGEAQEVTGIQFSQSDQAEKTEFKAYIVTTKRSEVSK